jgi:hypothetical protein
VISLVQIRLAAARFPATSATMISSLAIIGAVKRREE